MIASGNLKMMIHHNSEEVDTSVVRALAEQVVPKLRTAIQDEARKIVEAYGVRSPFAEDAAMRLLIGGLAGFLILSDVESSDDCVLPHQLTPKHVRYWLTSDDEWSRE